VDTCILHNHLDLSTQVNMEVYKIFYKAIFKIICKIVKIVILWWHKLQWNKEFRSIYTLVVNDNDLLQVNKKVTCF